MLLINGFLKFLCQEGSIVPVEMECHTFISFIPFMISFLFHPSLDR